MIECQTQQEVDHYWDNLSQGSDENLQQCGWLQDKFGIEWQVVPSVLGKLLSDPVKSERVMKVMMPMKKLVIDKLLEAYNQQ